MGVIELRNVFWSDRERDILLALLGAKDYEPIVGRTRLMKLLFIVDREARERGLIGEDVDYHFIPFRFGPWSMKVYLMLEELAREGLILVKKDATDKSTRYTYMLTEKGYTEAAKAMKRLGKEMVELITSVKERFNRLPLLHLTVYTCYNFEYACLLV